MFDWRAQCRPGIDDGPERDSGVTIQVEPGDRHSALFDHEHVLVTTVTMLDMGMIVVVIDFRHHRDPGHEGSDH